MDEHNESVEQQIEHPPLEMLEDEFEAPDTRWPKVIGIISLIYAILGLLCGVGGALMGVMSELIMGIAGIEATVPPAIKIMSGASAVVTGVIGLVLLFAAINLLRRRLSGVSLHKTWAVLRLIWVIIGVAMSVVLLSSQVDMKRSIIEATNEKLREADQPEQPFDEEKVARNAMISAGVMAGLYSIYPLFIGFYLSRHKISDEVAQWV